MKYFIGFIFTIFIHLSLHAQQLIVNEFSQGNSGTREYIELVVAGTKTCTDSCMDLRNWIIDDHNGWYGASSGQGIATGCMRFANIANWSCVPYGSIILLYNDGDKNTSITQSDDPTDANHDHVYIVPVNLSYLQTNSSTPISPSATNFVYPSTGFSNGGSWSAVGLANGGDAVIVTDPANPGTAAFSITYGNVNGGTIHKATSGGGVVYFLSDDQYGTATSWLTGSAGSNETPGAGNTAANTAWIGSMNTTIGGAVSTNLNTCILQGQQYLFGGQQLTTAGTYYDTLQAAAGCDSIIILDLAVVQPQHTYDTITGCNSIVYQGNVYTSSTILYDTLSTLLGCDSIYHEEHIIIGQIVPAIIDTTVSGCGSVTFNNTLYTTSQVINDTLLSVQGCDSVYAQYTIQIFPEVKLSVTNDTAICRGESILLSASGAPFINWTDIASTDMILVTPKQKTTYTVTGENEFGCADTATVTVDVEHLSLELDASDTLVTTGDKITLATSANINYEVVKWIPEALFAYQSNKMQEIIAEATRQYTVIAVSDAGCRDTASIWVTTEASIDDIFIPDVFSPNNDGRNDYFGPRFTLPFKIIEFRIFDRWGALVYESTTNHTQGWDGNYKNSPAPIGTYYYMLRAEGRSGKVIFRKGDVTLIR